ncbi:MAG: PEP-CTERM sorting domain-containing protein [Sedimentisphaerales bacterium]|nr:PEP-CTERM sorting domain-containing protein [Sedimentisphaerales bacterium]
MGKCKVFLAAIVVVLFNSMAHGELVSFVTDEVSSWSPSGAVISLGLPSVRPTDVTIQAESHSTFTITSTVTNETSVTWIGYEVTLDPTEAATFVPGWAGSTRFLTVNQIDDWTIRFLAPNDVPPGELVTLQFKIDIPDDGPYTFSLTQHPIPEPATVALLGLGGLALVMARKHD